MRVLRTAAAASLALAIVAGCRGLLDLPDVAGAFTDDATTPISTPADDATAAVAVDANVPVVCPRYIPPEGDYLYEAETASSPGRESVYILQSGAEPKNPFATATTPSPPSDGVKFIGRVKHTSATAWTFHLDQNKIDTKIYDFVGGAGTGLSVVSASEMIAGNDVKAACDPPVDLIKCPMVPATWLTAALGTINKTDKFDATLTYTYIDEVEDDRTYAIEGVLVPVFHLKEHRVFHGLIGGSEDNHYWLARKDGLMIHARLNIGDIDGGQVDGLTFVFSGYPVEYKGHAEFKITSLTPTPLPIVDAGADASQ